MPGLHHRPDRCQHTQQIEGGGNAGDIILNANSLDIVNGAAIFATTFGSGNGSLIDITAKSVTMANFGLISPATYGTGEGGSINVTADSVLLDSSFIQAVTTLPDGDSISGKGAQCSINTGSIDIRNADKFRQQPLAQVPAGYHSDGRLHHLTGDNGASGLPTGIRAASGRDFGDGFILVGTGNGGDIVIKPRDAGALNLNISGGAQISTATMGSGQWRSS